MWQTRTICSFVAATVPVEEKGADNPLLDEAQRIGEESDVDERQRSDDRSTSVIDPRTGSFESFMGSFGTPQRWAGRG